jgi:hypothetical protein
MPDVLTIPVPQGQGDDEMTEATAQFAALHDQNMAGMGTAMTRFQGDQVTVSKAADYSYLQGKDMVSLAEAMGAREVASEKNPGGPSKPD